MDEVLILHILSWMANYFIHSTVFVGMVLLAIHFKLIKFDRTGEWLMKSALVLGVVTALIQTNGWINNSLLADSLWQQKISVTPVVEPSQEVLRLVQSNSTELSNGIDQITTTERPVNPTPVRSGVKPSSKIVMNQVFWLMLWFVIASFLLGKQIIQRRKLHQLLQSRQTLSDSNINETFSELIKIGQFRDHVRLSCSDAVSTPVALSKEVVLPTTFVGEPKEQVEAAIAHELAHIKRCDYQWLSFSYWFRALTFFQPLNHLLNQQIHQLAELNADDLAAAWTKNPKALAKALFSVAKSNNISSNPTQMVPAMTSNKSKLLERVENIINQPSRKTKPMSVLSFMAIVVAILLAAPGVVAQNQTFASKSSQKSGLNVSQHIELNDGKTSMSVSYSDDNRSLKIKAKLTGAMQFNNDESRIIEFPANSKFDLTEDDGQMERRLVVKSGGSGGDPEYTYYEDGSKKTYDAGAQAWFAAAIPKVMRATGLNAKARVSRIQANGGDTAVLDEIALIDSDYVKKSYFKHLFALSQLSRDDMSHALELANHIESDFELSNVLSTMVETQNIQGESQWAEYMQATNTIQSDFEMAKTMINVLDQLPQSPKINESYFDAAATIQSDFEMAKVLLAYLEQQPANSVNMMKMFELATEIQSDFELAKVLMSVNNQLDEAEEVFSAYLDLATTIQSDFEMKKVFSNLLQHNLSDELLSQMIDSAASEIGSDFELANLLQEVAEQNDIDESVKAQIISVVKDSIGSSFEREKVYSAVL